MIASYVLGPGAFTIDPDSGDYYLGGALVSPDLRLSADARSPDVTRLFSNTDYTGSGLIEWPAPAGSPLWSPDGARLAASVIRHDLAGVSGDLAGQLTGQFRSLVIAEVADLTRHPGEDVVELATIDPGGAPQTTTTVPLPAPPEHYARTPLTVPFLLQPQPPPEGNLAPPVHVPRTFLPLADCDTAARTNCPRPRSVLMQLQLAVDVSDADIEAIDLAAWRYEHHVVDLASGQVRPADSLDTAAEAHTLLLEGAAIGTLGDAAWLSPRAAHLAFRP